MLPASITYGVSNTTFPPTTVPETVVRSEVDPFTLTTKGLLSVLPKNRPTDLVIVRGIS